MAEATQRSGIPHGMSWFGAFGHLHTISLVGFLVGEISFLIGFRQSNSWHEPTGGHTAIILTISLGLLLVLFLSLALTVDLKSWRKLGGLALILIAYAVGTWVPIAMQVGMPAARDDFLDLLISSLLAFVVVTGYFLIMEYFIVSGRLRGYAMKGGSYARVGLGWLASSEKRWNTAVVLLLTGLVVVLFFIPRGFEVVGGVATAVALGHYLIAQARKHRK